MNDQIIAVPIPDRERVRNMMLRFESGISCDDIGRQATLWYELMRYYLAKEVAK